MTVLFTHEIHASKINGKYYNKGGIINSKALLNYLNSCPNGILITRCIDEDDFEQGTSYLDLEIDGNSAIKIIPIKEFSFRTFIKNIKIVNNAIRSANCYLIRLPGLTGIFVGLILFFRKKRFGVELAGDLREGLNEIYAKPRFSKKVQFSIFEKINRFLIRHAVAVGYRSNLLSVKYPNKFMENHYIFSGAQIFSEDIGSVKDPHYYKTDRFELLYLGRLSPEKGFDSLLQAIFILKNENLNIHLTVIGDGIQLTSIKDSIRELELNNSITLKGKITDKKIIHKYMDSSHLFVIPSLTEGMPRALIEAMARGMVVVGSNVGGIPELLSNEFLFEAGNPRAIARKVKLMLKNPEELSNISRENLLASEGHWYSNLKHVKDEFWKKLMNNDHE